MKRFLLILTLLMFFSQYIAVFDSFAFGQSGLNLVAVNEKNKEIISQNNNLVVRHKYPKKDNQSAKNSKTTTIIDKPKTDFTISRRIVYPLKPQDYVQLTEFDLNNNFNGKNIVPKEEYNSQGFVTINANHISRLTSGEQLYNFATYTKTQTQNNAEVQTHLEEIEPLKDENLKISNLESESLKKERIEQESSQALGLETDKREAQRLKEENGKKENLKSVRLEAKKLEEKRKKQAMLQAKKLEAERLEQEKLEAERLEQEKLEAERLEQERLEALKLANPYKIVEYKGDWDKAWKF